MTSMDPRDDLKKAGGSRTVLEWPSSSNLFLFMGGEHTFSLYVGFDLVFHFDAEGRFRRAFIAGKHYLRGLDGKVLRKMRAGDRSARDGLPPEPPLSVDSLYELVHSCAVQAFGDLRESEIRDGRSYDEIRDRLEGVVRFDPDRLRGEADRFREVYEPLGVLPPDCYGTLILQATAGCSYNRCAFCSLYRDVRYRRKSPREFRDHLMKVKDFLGRAISLRRGVFLGEANALDLPQGDLLAILDTVGELVPDLVGKPNHGGIYTFSDLFQADGRDSEQFRELRDRGLRRVYLGVESGSDVVLRSLRKPTDRARILRRVRDLKAGGLSVGLIFLVGAGGRYRDVHVEETIGFLGTLDLDRSDLVYLSRLTWPSPRTAGDPPPPPGLGETELRDEEEALARGIRSLGLRVGRYDVDSFVYY